MIEIRQFKIDDYEEVVDMFYEFTKEVFHNRKIGSKYFFYMAVETWINQGRDIVVAIKDNNIVGFTACFIDDMGGLTDKVYDCNYCYVKPNYRKNSRVAYMLYNNAYMYAKENNLSLVTNGRIENGTSAMMEKHFELEPKFINYERIVK